jgi:hypothetical protein
MVRLRNAMVGLLVTAALSVPYAASGQQQPAAPQAGPSMKDAPVLCVWKILIATQVAAEKCDGGEDAALQAELASSIKRVDAFIVANDPTATLDKLAAYKQRFRDQAASQDVCSDPDAKAAYADAKRAGADRIRADTDDLISTPRAPTGDGC